MKKDLQRLIHHYKIKYLVTLVPDYQLARCNCSNLLSVAKRSFGEDKTLHYPIHDFCIPEDINHFDEHCIQPLLAERRRNSDNMLIHCYGGHGRTGIVVACLLMR